MRIGGGAQRHLDGGEEAQKALSEGQLMALRERLYGAVSALSLLLVYRHEPDAQAWPTLANLMITALGLWGAALVAELLAHTAAHQMLPDRIAVSISVRATWQIVQAAAVPAVLLVLAGLNVIRTQAALTAGVITLEVSLGLFAYFAVWRTRLGVGKKIVVTGSVLLIGAGVIALKTLVH